jgi:RHS repeat-associated protein
VEQYTVPIAAATLTYDTDGNMLTDGTGWNYTWNGENRMIVAEKSDMKLEFSYDFMGRRINKKVYTGSTGNWTLSTYQKFVYQGFKQIAEFNASDVLQKTYTWQPVDLDVPLWVKNGANYYYYIVDGNKNVRAMVDTSGSLVAEYDYNPFGKIVVSSGAYKDANKYRFSSEYHDDETGLVYYNYRYYSPTLGRWLSLDPIGKKGGFNLYGFCRNNPINRWDHLGQISLGIKMFTKYSWRLSKIGIFGIFGVAHNWWSSSNAVVLWDDDNEVRGYVSTAANFELRKSIIKQVKKKKWKNYALKKVNIAKYGNNSVLTIPGGVGTTGWFLNDSDKVYIYGKYNAKKDSTKYCYKDTDIFYEWHDNIDANSFKEAMNKGAFDEYFSKSTYSNTIESTWDAVGEKVLAVDFKVIIKGKLPKDEGSFLIQNK